MPKNKVFYLRNGSQRDGLSLLDKASLYFLLKDAGECQNKQISFAVASRFIKIACNFLYANADYLIFFN